jgi:hypothetical protein
MLVFSGAEGDDNEQVGTMPMMVLKKKEMDKVHTRERERKR